MTQTITLFNLTITLFNPTITLLDFSITLLGFALAKPYKPYATRVFEWLTITLLDFSLVERCLVALFIAFLSLKLTLRLQLHYGFARAKSKSVIEKSKSVIVSHSKTLVAYGLYGFALWRSHTSYMQPEFLNG
jgi:hypothetical protein